MRVRNRWLLLIDSKKYVNVIDGNFEGYSKNNELINKIMCYGWYGWCYILWMLKLKWEFGIYLGFLVVDNVLAIVIGKL